MLTNAPDTATTFYSFGVERLAALWQAVMQSDCPRDVRDLFAAMVAPWGATALPVRPAWPSDITDDHTPFEFSAVFGTKRPELRILVEAQGARPTLAANVAAGRELNRALAARGADLERFAAVADLFLPEEPSGKFALWHAAALTADHAPSFRVYLNPQVNGVQRAYATVEEALRRLGMAEALPVLAAGARRGPARDELRYFSLDLSSDRRARVKIYVYHHEATVDVVDRAYSVGENYVPGAVAEFCESVAGTRGALPAPPGTCFAFVQGKPGTSATLHLPVRFYAENDRVAREHVRGYLVRNGIPTDAYERTLEAVARRPLEAGSGMQTYGSLRLEPSGPRVTVYLATEAFHAAAPRPQRIVAGSN